MRNFTRRRPTLLLALVVLAASAILSAQQQPPPVQKPPQPKPQATPQAPRFKSATDVITTDVHVTDDSGRFIPDLTVKDFEVYEDGVLQTVSNFVAMVGGRAMTEMVKTEEPVREGLIVPRSSKPVSTPGRIFIIFIDDLHLQPLDSIKAKAVLKQIRDNVLHEDDLVGIVSSGYSSISFDLSPDAQHLRMNQAIDKTMGAGMTPYEIINTSQTMEGPSGLRANAYTAFKTAYEILDQAEKVTNRRKAFIYVSSGYDFNPFTESRYKAAQDLYATALPEKVIDQGRPNNQVDPLTSLSSAAGTGVYRNPFEMNGLQFSQADLAAALSELVRRARRADVVFYPIDPRGLDAGPDASQTVSLEEWHQFMNNSLSSLDVIAGETGGKCICRTNDFKKPLQALDNEMSDYYIVGYESNNPDPLKVNRHIEIKVKRAGAKLIYKDSYSIRR
jgi:VWFA-related protein